MGDLTGLPVSNLPFRPGASYSMAEQLSFRPPKMLCSKPSPRSRNNPFLFQKTPFFAPKVPFPCKSIPFSNYFAPYWLTRQRGSSSLPCTKPPKKAQNLQLNVLFLSLFSILSSLLSPLPFFVPYCFVQTIPRTPKNACPACPASLAGRPATCPALFCGTTILARVLYCN